MKEQRKGEKDFLLPQKNGWETRTGTDVGQTQERQLQIVLENLDKLHVLSSDSSKGASVTEELVNLNRGSDVDV